MVHNGLSLFILGSYIGLDHLVSYLGTSVYIRPF